MKLAFPKPKKVKHSTIKKKAWAEFSRYIRQKYSYGGGFVKCYTCGKVEQWKKMQAGHGIGGRGNAILFEEKLVRVQCVGCNVFGRGQYQKFTYNLIKELGFKEYEKLVEQSITLRPLKDFELQEIYEKYKKLNTEAL